jgi:hypothetical protein
VVQTLLITRHRRRREVPTDDFREPASEFSAGTVAQPVRRAILDMQPRWPVEIYDGGLRVWRRHEAAHINVTGGAVSDTAV